MNRLPGHASPMISPLPRAPAQFLSNWDDLRTDSRPATPGIPTDLISPAYTPPLTPSTPATPGGTFRGHEPKSVPVDTSLDSPTQKQPRLVQRLPVVECLVRARIPTTSGTEMFLYLYKNDSDDKEHLAIVFGDKIRSKTLDAEKPNETERDRLIRGAYVGRLRPGRVSSRRDDSDDLRRRALAAQGKQRPRSSSLLSKVTSADTVPDENVLELTPAQSTSDGDEFQHRQNEQGEAASPSPTNPPNFQDPASAPSSTPQTNVDVPTTIPHEPRFSPLVRIHSECYTGETAWSARCDCGEQLDEAARLMSTPSKLNPHADGVIVYLRQEGRGIGLASKLMAYNLQDLGHDTVEANVLLRHPADARTYGLATAILVDLGLGTAREGTREGNTEAVEGIRLLTNNPDKIRAVEGPNKEVRVVERVAMVPLAWQTGGRTGVKGAEIEKYLETKIGRMGHMLS